MRVSLVVLTAGKSLGKVVPITRSEFIIGRAPQAHLRPASALISQRHCALVIREEKAFVQDFNSTNGTFVNGRQIKGEFELLHNDRLKVGPLEFGVRLETDTPKAAPRPSDEEAIAAALLGLDSEGPKPGGGVDVDGVPTGSTVFDGTLIPKIGPPPGTPDKPAGAGTPSKSETSSAARDVLQKLGGNHELQKVRGPDKKTK